MMVLLVANRCGIFLALWALDHTDILCRGTYSDGRPTPSSKQMWYLPGMKGFRSHRYLMQRYLQ